MADENNEKKSGGLPLKSVLIIAIIILVETAFFAAWMILGGGPDVAEADIAVVEQQVQPSAKELLIVENMRVPNSRTGKLMMYDIKVGIEAEDSVEVNLEELSNKYKLRIQDSIYTIISQADPYLFKEPQRLTLKRQIQSALEEYFGEGTIKSVLIPALVGFRGE